MPRWDRPLDHPDSPYRRSAHPTGPVELPFAPGDRSLESSWALWLYLGKGLLICILAGLLLSNAMYAFALLDLLAG